MYKYYYRASFDVIHDALLSALVNITGSHPPAAWRIAFPTDSRTVRTAFLRRLTSWHSDNLFIDAEVRFPHFP